MADYRKMYLRLVDKTEQVLDILDSDRDPGQKVFLAKALLAAGLQECEDIYIETAEYETNRPGGQRGIFHFVGRHDHMPPLITRRGVVTPPYAALSVVGS